MAKSASTDEEPQRPPPICDVPGCGRLTDPSDPTIKGKGLRICDRHGGIRDKDNPLTALRTGGFQDSGDADLVRLQKGIK